jgi:hypothetical protein
MFINFVFKFEESRFQKENEILNIFYIEKILKHILTPYQFCFKLYKNLEDGMVCFIFESKNQKSPPPKILNKIPKGLGITKYGYEVNNSQVKIMPADLYGEYFWDYKHGECKVNLD